MTYGQKMPPTPRNVKVTQAKQTSKVLKDDDNIIEGRKLIFPKHHLHLHFLEII